MKTMKITSPFLLLCNEIKSMNLCFTYETMYKKTAHPVHRIENTRVHATSQAWQRSSASLHPSTVPWSGGERAPVSSTPPLRSPDTCKMTSGQSCPATSRPCWT